MWINFEGLKYNICSIFRIIENIYMILCILNFLKLKICFNIEVNFDFKKTYRREIQDYVEN